VARHAPIFQARAQAAGITLRANVAVPWLTRHGHLEPDVQRKLPQKALDALDRILTELGGDADALASKTRGSSRVDFILEAAGAIVEYDEVQHFTSARLKTLALYPRSSALGFDLDAYIEIVRRWASRGDRAFAHKTAAEFPGGAGRQRQRAYLDAFRDLAAPHCGSGPILRIASPENDYGAAVVLLEKMIDAL
jgi:hypothetical protein